MTATDTAIVLSELAFASHASAMSRGDMDTAEAFARMAETYRSDDTDAPEEPSQAWQALADAIDPPMTTDDYYDTEDWPDRYAS